MNVTTLLKRFLADESGQDLVEYGLLGALVGIAAILVWQQLVTTVGTTYTSADGQVQQMSLCTPAPGATTCP